jgi:hypothetical protein
MAQTDFKTDITKEESDFLKSYLNKNSVVLEWGSGWSTVEYSALVKEYYSIEHDFGWYEDVKERIGKNARIYFVPPNTTGIKFKSYINFAGVLGSLGKKFDIVFIDGRSRLECAIEALKYLNAKSVVFIHDFCRPYYWDVIKHYRIAGIVGNMVALEKGNFSASEKDRYFLIKKYLTLPENG